MIQAPGHGKVCFEIWQGRNGRPWQLVLLHRNSLGAVVATLVTVRGWIQVFQIVLFYGINK